ncbi:MAG: phospho-sugar mutase [Acidimicrobiales bacterium]
MNDQFRQQVEAWIALDPDENDRDMLTSLLDLDDEVELERRFVAPLAFGTAGLRGPEMAGPAGMNRATVRRATLGVLAWMGEIGVDASRGVVVGRDGRRGSETFNDEVVAVLLGGGATVYEMPSALPTPLVAYCVKALNASAGIVITASHNPPEDNGYKLYASDGAQIVPPDDEIVERHMRHATEATLGERSSSEHSYISDMILEEYQRHIVGRFHVEGGSDLAITYTPLHGVGGATMTRSFSSAGFSNVTTVARQFEPDGSFPTLPFPNPEEPGALDLAIETAKVAKSSIIIANDPDADRLGAAVRDGKSWRVLRGDEIGWLLASSLMEGVHERGETVATTIVSSTLLEKMAHAHGVNYATTLTGFKWLARSAGEGVLGFAYEEALGFAVDSHVADKDGLSAALAFAVLASDLASRGSSLIERLDEIESTYGVHLTSQLSIRADGPEGLGRLRHKVKGLADHPPVALGGIGVTEVSDLGSGFWGLLRTDGVWLGLGTMGRVVARPSGTEAKVKAYVEVTPPRDGTLHEQRTRAREITERILDSLRELLSG